MIINYPGKYSDLKRFFLDKTLKIIHNFYQEINTNLKTECMVAGHGTNCTSTQSFHFPWKDFKGYM
jgi:hypothetical protein